ncbi:Uncharacterised protein [Klebsiella michiganensis]|uniref:Uncharacterized protein n=1 Tax=Klebsiella michiganensis TaxID=1134687 RepID=A0A7H4M4D5_9ENTR|nr:Uncharacterised protein [Klebsiella michiganensis]
MCLMLKCILKLLLNMLCNNLAWNIYQISLVGDPGFLRIRTDNCSEPLGV